MDSKFNFRTVLLYMIFSIGLAHVINRHGSSKNIMSIGDKKITASKIMEENHETADNRTILRVALFPYIPDSAGDNFYGLLQFIEHNFERFYPQYNLQLRPISVTDDFYDLSTLIDWLTSNVNGYDVIELDTIILGDVVNTGLIAPQTIPSSMLADWNSAAINAIQFNQAYYAFPHLQCAFFLITYISDAAKATTIDQLIRTLGGTPSNIHRIVGNLDSSWELPALWLNSLFDTYNDTNNTLARGLHDYNIYTFDSLRKLARLCDILPNNNPCLDGTFDDPDEMTDVFIRNQAAALFGYSERLFRIIKNGPPGAVNNLKVSPLQLGTLRNEPVFFTDAFVYRKNLANNVREAAQSFVQFMGLPAMQAIYVGSGDIADFNRIPRYLLPVSKSAYDEAILKLDPIYQQVFRKLNGTSYPTIGFLNARKALQSTILRYIQ